MNAEQARKRLEGLAVAPSDENLLKYLKAGDREIVELLLDSGVSPDICDSERNAAIIVAVQSGQKDLARVLLTRGASSEPLLNRPPSKKDTWDKVAASSSVLSFFSGILIAVVGGYFTYSYNQRQIDLNRTQAEHDAATKLQANKVLELEAVQKLIPALTSKDEQTKAAALIALQDLAHPELAAHFAVLFKGSGSVQYLQQAALSENANAKRTAVQALSTIAAIGPTSDAQLASRALSTVFDSTKASVVQVVAVNKNVTTTGSGVVLTNDGFILTSAHIFAEGSSPAIHVTTVDKVNLQARRITYNYGLDLAILKVDGVALNPVRLSAKVVKPGSEVIGIGYASGMSEMAFVGSVASVDAQHLYFTSNLVPGVAGGPLFDDTGAVVGLISFQREGLSFAIRGDIALQFAQVWKVPISD